MTFKMMILGRGSLQLVYSLMILLQLKTSIGFNSTTSGYEVRCIERERQALLAFKRGLVDEYGRLSSWGTEEKKRDCCKWERVQCSNSTRHIIKLHLRGLYLKGKLNPSLFELQHLTYLDLSLNDFNLSRIPKSIGSLNKIQYLDLRSYNLSGPLPSELENLTNLLFLSISENDFLQGFIPKTFDHMISLKYLDLSYNQLGGKIPKSLFGNMCKLRHLLLAGNNFQGLPHEFIGNLSGCLEHPLEVLALEGNQFLGPLPELITNFSSLRELYLSNNKLVGIIPKSIRFLSKLELLDFSSNSFEGVINEAHFSLLKTKSSKLVSRVLIKLRISDCSYLMKPRF